MPTPPKPVSMLRAEKKSHRTKRELQIREDGEKAFATGVVIRESQNVKSNLIAHTEFKRLLKLLQKIEKADAIYQTVINRYCIIFAECEGLERKYLSLESTVEKLTESFEVAIEAVEDEVKLDYIINFTNEVGKITGLQKNIDKQLQTKRKMLFDIEKENIMTIAAALRNIPKKEENKENPLLKALHGD